MINKQDIDFGQVMENVSQNEVRIKSTELVELVNKFRELEGNRAKLRHNDFMRKIRSELEILESLKLGGQRNISQSSYINSQNKEQPCYSLNRDGMLQMLNSESTLVRAKTIEYINKLEKDLQKQNTVPKIDSKFMFQIAQQLEEKENQIQSMKPKALFADAVATSKSSVLVGELAKILKQNNINIGQNRMFEWLRGNGYLMSRKGESWNMPTQKSMDLELFEIKVRTINNADGSIRTTKTPKVTGKGQIYFVNKFNDLQQLRIVNI